MNTKELLGLSAVFFMLLGHVPYLVNMFRGVVRPHLFSWSIWLLLSSTVFWIQTDALAGPGAWSHGSLMIVNTIIVIWAWKWGKRVYSRFDWICLVLAVAGFGWYLILREWVGAMILITCADLIGFLPTIRGAMREPHQESAWLFGCDAFKYFFAFLAVENLVFENVFYPLVISGAGLITCLTILYFRAHRRVMR